MDRCDWTPCGMELDPNGDYVASDVAVDLLAALKAASEVLVQDDCPMIYAQVQAALAKAEGRT